MSRDWHGKHDAVTCTSGAQARGRGAGKSNGTKEVDKSPSAKAPGSWDSKSGFYSRNNGEPAQDFKQRSNMIIQFSFSRIIVMKEEKVTRWKSGDCESNKNRNNEALASSSKTQGSRSKSLQEGRLREH